MMSKIDMTNLSVLYYFLGLEFYRGDHGIFIYQHMMDMLKKFNMLNCKTISTPINTSEKLCINYGTQKIDEQFFRRIVGSLMYLTHTRPNIMLSVSILSRFIHCPSSQHLGAAKRILKYNCGTMDLRIHYPKVQNFNLVGYSDSD